MGTFPPVFDPAVVSRLAGSMLPLAALPDTFIYEIRCADDRRRLSKPTVLAGEMYADALP